MDPEAVVIRLDGVRVLPYARIVRRENAVVDHTVRQFCTGEQHRRFVWRGHQRAWIGRRFRSRGGWLVDHTARRRVRVDNACRGMR